MAVAVWHIFKGSIFAINAVIRNIIVAAVAASVVEAAKVDFYVFAFKY